MSYTVKLTRASSNDIKQAQQWYEAQKPGLGASFYQSVKERISYLSENPYTYTTRYENLRQALVTGYPYIVHYLVDESRKYIIVLAVQHTSRNPETWKERNK